MVPSLPKRTMLRSLFNPFLSRAFKSRRGPDCKVLRLRGLDIDVSSHRIRQHARFFFTQPSLLAVTDAVELRVVRHRAHRSF